MKKRERKRERGGEGIEEGSNLPSIDTFNKRMCDYLDTGVRFAQHCRSKRSRVQPVSSSPVLVLNLYVCSSLLKPTYSKLYFKITRWPSVITV